MAGFRSYDSYKASFDDYVDFIKSNPRYSEALKKADNAAQYVRELQKAGYATDPRYAEKIMNIYHSQVSAQSQANTG
jgi:flagellar protein FlgJ